MYDIIDTGRYRHAYISNDVSTVCYVHAMLLQAMMMTPVYVDTAWIQHLEHGYLARMMSMATWHCNKRG